MSGGVLWIKDGVAHLTATEEYRPDPVDFAVQCKPRLVVGSRVNIRSDDGRRAPRTALCLRKAGASIEADVALGDGDDGGPTLMELATELADASCEEALNLDGGPSTGWASRWGRTDRLLSPARAGSPRGLRERPEERTHAPAMPRLRAARRKAYETGVIWRRRSPPCPSAPPWPSR